MSAFVPVSNSPPLFLVLLAFLLPFCCSYPYGAGSCRPARNALGGPHVYQTQVGGGNLSDYGLELRLDSKALVPGVTEQIQIGRDYAVKLVAKDAMLSSFRGFLIRLESSSVDTRSALRVAPSATDIQVSDYLCVAIEHVGGLTHTDRNDKTSVRGTLRMNEAAVGMYLDVTVVVRNAFVDGISEFYYSEYILDAVESLATPSPTPESTPNPTTISPSTEAPSMTPSGSPSVPPTGAPSKATSTPTLLPTPDPSASPTGSPTAQPTHVPSKSPSIRPTDTPSVSVPEETKDPAQIKTQAPSTLTRAPSEHPSGQPSHELTSNSPSMASQSPSTSPSTAVPLVSDIPSTYPTVVPSMGPTDVSIQTTASPSTAPSASPSHTGESPPTILPTASPSSTEIQHSIPPAPDALTKTDSPTRDDTGNAATTPTTDATTASPSSSSGGIRMYKEFWGWMVALLMVAVV